MCLRVLSVTGMPFNTEIWVDDRPDCFTVYIDRELMSERGAAALQAILRSTVTGWQRIDQATMLRTLRAVTG